MREACFFKIAAKNSKIDKIYSCVIKNFSIIIIIIIILTTPFKTYLNRYLEIISRNHRKQPHWALHTYFGKCSCKSAERLTWEITCTVYRKHRIAAKLYTLGTHFVSGVYL